MGEGNNSPEERHVRSYADLHMRWYADTETRLVTLRGQLPTHFVKAGDPG